MGAGAGRGEGRVDTPVSALDILPTLLDLAGIDAETDAGALDGESLLPLAGGGTRRRPVAMEYAAEGSAAPLVSIRDGRFKFNHCELDPPQLVAIPAAPLARHDLAGEPAHAHRVRADKPQGEKGGGSA